MSHVKKMIAKKMLYYFWDKKELYNETFRKIQKLNDKFDHDSLQYIQKKKMVKKLISAISLIE